jgi:predicted alpha/beta hydrolase family esterase
MVPAFVARQPRAAARLLIVPGLHDSGPAHWQSWLQSIYRPSVRVVQRDWGTPDLDRWAARVGSTLERAGPGPWIVAAHSFGCLAVARHLALQPDSPVSAALLVAPADPDKFGVGGLLPTQALPVSSTVVTSDTDPWMTAANARRWAQRWGSHTVNLGDAGHINSEAGFGPLPFARRWITAMAQRLERGQRASRASLAEWSFAI